MFSVNLNHDLIVGINYKINLTLKYYRFFFVTLMISSGLPDPVFKNKKIPFSSTAVYHIDYTENRSLTEQFKHLQNYFTLI